MIKCEKGECMLNGTGKELLYEFMNIVQGIAETMDEDVAKDIIPAAVSFALTIMDKPNVVEREVSEGVMN